MLEDEDFVISLCNIFLFWMFYSMPPFNYNLNVLFIILKLISWLLSTDNSPYLKVLTNVWLEGAINKAFSTIVRIINKTQTWANFTTKSKGSSGERK